MANEAKWVFGTQDDLDSSSASVTDTSFSITSDLTSWTNDDDYPLADVCIEWQHATGTLADPPLINLYLRKMNVEGTNDEPVPDGTSSAYAQHYVGTFIGDQNQSTATNQYNTIEIALPQAYSSQVYEFYIENQTDVTLTSGWTIFVTPKSWVPGS